MAPVLDRSAAIGFGFNPLDRQSERREDDNYVAELRRSPQARFLVLAGEVPLLQRRGEALDPLFAAADLKRFNARGAELFLGLTDGGAPIFAVDVGAAALEALGETLEGLDLRSVAMRGLFTPEVTGTLGGAKAMLDWHARHGFCARCGHRTVTKAAGWRRECIHCDAQHFPRVDPVVIMLTLDGERCLLGRQERFAPGMYSALAGFLEPGETMEDAVRREVQEEAGIRCGKVVYFASQPWPFPSSLMIGCFAQALETGLTIDPGELEDARWFSREDARAMLDGSHPDGLGAPKPFAIAHHLLREFVDRGPDVLE